MTLSYLPSQQTPNGFWEEFVKTLDALNYPPSDAIRQAVYAYDAVWAAGFALDTVAEELELHNMTITDFNYSRSDINEMILKVARGLDFRGVSVSSRCPILLVTLLKMRRYCSTTTCHYWDMSVK